MLPSIVRRTTQKGVPYIYTNAYKAKRLWPPDFAKLPPKHQFRLERRYKRRAKLKWARPRWTKAVKLVQMGTIVFVAVYGVLFLDWNAEAWGNEEAKPFEGIRGWFWGIMGSVWTKDQAQRHEPDAKAPSITSIDR